MRYFLLPLVGAVMAGAAPLAFAGNASTEPYYPDSKERPMYLEESGSSQSQPLMVADPANAASTAAGQHMMSIMAVPPAMPATDPVSTATEEVAEMLAQGLSQARVQRLPLAVMPFVERPYVRKQNALGERLSESFLYQLQSRGFNLVDYRAVSMNTTVKPDLNARQLSGLRSRFRIYFVLTGTYARYPDGIVINARVLDTTTRQVVASGQTHIDNDQLEGMLPGYDPLTAMRKGMIIENGEGPAGL